MTVPEDDLAGTIPPFLDPRPNGRRRAYLHLRETRSEAALDLADRLAPSFRPRVRSRQKREGDIE